MNIYSQNHSVNIVAYHYVREIKNSQFPNIKGIEYNLFKKQIKFFKEKFNIISADDLIEILDKKKNYSKPCLLLTFDDGYKDHYDYVFPLLLKEKIRGCFYPPVNIFKGHIFDVNKIHFILEKCKNTSELLNTINLYLKKNFGLDIDKNKLKAINSNSIYNKFKKIPKWDDAKTVLIKEILQNHFTDDIRKKTCDYLFRKYVKINPKDFAKHLYLNINQLKEMDKAGMHIGCHGVTHIQWKKLNDKAQENEIIKSKNFFSNKKINIENFSVCYPWGSYNAQSYKIMKKIKISFALTSNHGNFIASSKINRFKIPRFDAKYFSKL
tara:strand:- start:3057 stop:4028 length:972 start_codon:yes stop_codon:yes gene_type:complete